MANINYIERENRQRICKTHVNTANQAFAYFSMGEYPLVESAKWHMLAINICFKLIDDACKVNDWDWNLMYVNYFVAKSGKVVQEGRKLTIEEWLAFSDFIEGRI
jgi:hypothetical protein